MSRSFLPLEVARAGDRAREVDRLHRIELEDILGVRDGDDEKFHHYVPKLRGYISRCAEKNGHVLQLEPLLAVSPWWTAHPTRDLLISNQYHRAQMWVSESRRRLGNEASLRPVEQMFVLHLGADLNWLAKQLNAAQFKEYVAETHAAHNAGETYIPLMAP